MNQFVIITGNIGVGKSSLTSLLARRLAWTAFFEPVDENPYLADFYTDMARWSFHSQLFFLSRRLFTYRELLAHPGDAIQDRSVYEDAEIFAANLHQQGLIQPRDWETYQSLYQSLTALLPRPSLIVYLRASTPILLKRIKRRGRAFERSIKVEYLEQLQALYEAWTARCTLCPVLTIDTDPMDFVRYPLDFEHIAQSILARLRDADVAG